MIPLQFVLRLFRAARTWIVLGILGPLGLLAISGFLLLDLRHDAWEMAEQTSRNLLQVLERDIARNAEMYDLSIQAAADNLRSEGVAEASPQLRQLILFDRAATARDLGMMLVIGERGDVIADLDAIPPRAGHHADREYFQVHKARADLGLYVGRPIVSHLTGERMLPFSRRINKPDGTFGGVVLGSIKLSYFTHLFQQIDLGRNDAINLYLEDGTPVMRHPFNEAEIGVNIANSPTFQSFLHKRSGSFVRTSARDGNERYYTFTQVGDLPLVLNIALDTDAIEAQWRTKAIVIGAIVLVLCSLTIGLSFLFGRELRRREAAQAQFERLSLTDALTGLPNRRAFEDSSSHAWTRTRRDGASLSLLIIDVDHFKRINDHYGHQVGDEVLKVLASRLSACVCRPDDLVCRIGGEEFAVLLPYTDRSGALRIAETVHAEISTLSIGSAGIGAGAITVSIGLSAVIPNGMEDTSLTALYRFADGALYEAKSGGRNQTCCARPNYRTVGVQRRPLQIVKGS